MDSIEASAKRKAPTDTGPRNVKPKTSNEAISVSLSQDQAYQLLAHLPPDQELFKSIARDVIRRSAPERRFQEAVVDDILETIKSNGMAEERAQPTRKTFNDILREHLTQKFSEGIGRTQPSLKATRNVLLQILRAFEKSHPGQVPGDVGRKLYSLFSPGSEDQQNSLDAGVLFPSEQRDNQVDSTEPASIPMRPPQEKDAGNNLRMPSVPRAVQQADGSRDHVQDTTNNEQRHANSNLQVASTNSVIQAHTEPAKSEAVASSGEGVVEQKMVNVSPRVNGSLSRANVSEGGPANDIGEKRTPHAMSVRPVDPASKLGIPGITGHGEARQKPEPAAVSTSSQTASHDIDALIQECSRQDGAPEANASAVPVHGQQSHRAQESVSAAPTTIPTRRISERATSKIQEALKRLRASDREPVREGNADTDSSSRYDAKAFDHTPTSSIKSNRLTCWYWYYRQPPCQHLDKYCHYSHDIKSHVAARTKSEPPVRLVPEFARRRMVNLGLLDDHDGPSKAETRDGMMTIKGSADKASMRSASNSVHVKSENDYEDNLTYDGPRTPVLDLLLRPQESTTPTNRELVLNSIKDELLRRGKPEDWRTKVVDEKGRPKDLSLVRHEGLQSKMFGLFNTFHANPEMIRSALESLLRPLVQANPDKFPELVPWFSDDSPSGLPQHRTASTSFSASYQPRRSDVYRPRDVSAAIRGRPLADDGPRYDEYPSYETRRGPPDRVPAWNAEWMTCPYWLKGSCVKGSTCKFVHEITHCLAGVPGKQRPRPLAPDGTILSNDQKLP